MKLLTSQKDELFDLIASTNYFTPTQFEIKEIPRNDKWVETEIRFKNSNYYFTIFPAREYQGIFFANFSPGNKSIIEATSNMDWDGGLNSIDNWLTYLNRELSADNKWEKMLQEIEQIKFAPKDDQTKFTYKEYIDLSYKLDKIKSSLNTIPLLLEQQTALVNQLNHLQELAKDLNKFDWKNLFIGTIISIVIQLSVTQENSAKLWNLIKSIFSSFFLP